MKIQITGIQRLVLKPGDRLVVRTPDRLTAEGAVMLRERLLGWVPGGVEILILDAGASLEVVEPPRPLEAEIARVLSEQAKRGASRAAWPP